MYISNTLVINMKIGIEQVNIYTMSLYLLYNIYNLKQMVKEQNSGQKHSKIWNVDKQVDTIVKKIIKDYNTSRSNK